MRNLMFAAEYYYGGVAYYPSKAYLSFAANARPYSS